MSYRQRGMKCSVPMNTAQRISDNVPNITATTRQALTAINYMRWCVRPEPGACMNAYAFTYLQQLQVDTLTASLAAVSTERDSYAHQMHELASGAVGNESESLRAQRIVDALTNDNQQLHHELNELRTHYEVYKMLYISFCYIMRCTIAGGQIGVADISA